MENKNLMKKLFDIKNDLVVGAKDGSSTFGKYRTEDQLLTALNKVAKTHNVMFILNSHDTKVEANGKGFGAYTQLYIDWTDLDSGETYRQLGVGAGQNTKYDFAVGGSITYGGRYMIDKMVGVGNDNVDPENKSVHQAYEKEMSERDLILEELRRLYPTMKDKFKDVLQEEFNKDIKDMKNMTIDELKAFKEAL